MADDHIPEPHDLQTTEGGARLALDDVMEVRMRVTADLGQSSMKVREIMGLHAGSIVALDKVAGEMTDIRVNGLAIARGEVVVISDILHVRISEIVGGVDPLEITDA